MRVREGGGVGLVCTGISSTRPVPKAPATVKWPRAVLDVPVSP